MLEFFRKHKGAFLITLTVIIIISFSVWGGWKGVDDQKDNSHEVAFTVYGKDYTVAEARRVNTFVQLISALEQRELLQALMSAAQDPTAQGNDYLFNLLVLRREMVKAGIHPSDAEARAELEKVASLQENGVFSQTLAHNLETNLGRFGMGGQDMLDAMKVSIGYKRLKGLIANNYVPSPLSVEKAYASENQTLKISTISFKLDDFKKNVKVTDEEIQKYYDENKANYMTEERRAVSYVLYENPKDLDKKPLEERQKLQKEVRDQVDAFTTEILKPDANLTKIAADKKATVQTLALFTQDSPPDALRTDRQLVSRVFNSEPKKIEAVKGNAGYYIYSVTELEEPKQQELAAVKDKITETLTTQKAQEELTKAVTEARKALAEGLTAGKKIDELAKEKNLTLSPVTELNVAQPAPGLQSAYQIAREAKQTPAGELADVVETPGSGAIIVYVHDKELRKSDQSEGMRKSQEQSQSFMGREQLFNAWFSQRRQEADVKLRAPAQKASA